MDYEGQVDPEEQEGRGHDHEREGELAPLQVRQALRRPRHRGRHVGDARQEGHREQGGEAGERHHRREGAPARESQPIEPPHKETDSVAYPGLVLETHHGSVTWHAPLEIAPGTDPRTLLAETVRKVEADPRITVYRNARLKSVEGFVGAFESVIQHDGGEAGFSHGVIVVATGHKEYEPTEYLYGKSERVVTQTELEERLAECGIPFWPHGFVTAHCDIAQLLENWTNEYACLAYGENLYPALADFCELTGIRAVAL